MRLFFLSLLNVMRKELVQVLRDRRMVATLIIAPVIQLVIFGYALDLDVDHIPTVVCDQDRTPDSRALVDAFFAEGTFKRSLTVDDPEDTHAALESGDAAAIGGQMKKVGEACGGCHKEFRKPKEQSYKN